jgi:hypothetical protein
MPRPIYRLVPTGQESAQDEAKIDSPVIHGHSMLRHYTEWAILASLNVWQGIIFVVSDMKYLTS